MKSPSISLSRIILIVLGFLSTLIIGTIILQGVVIQPVSLDDYPINYIAAKNWIKSNRSPYDLTNSEDAKSMMDDGYSQVANGVMPQYRNLPLTVLIYLPFTLLPLEQSRALWTTVSILCLAVGGLLLVLMQRQRLSYWLITASVIFCSLNIFSVQSLFSANIIPLIFLVIISTVYLLLDNKDTMAGFLSTLALMNIQFGIFAILFLVLWTTQHRRKHFLRSFWAGMSFEIAISLILIPNWPVSYLRSILLDIVQNGRYTSFLSQLFGNSFPLAGKAALITHLALLLVMIITWIAYKAKDEKFLLWIMAVTMIVTSLVVFPITAGHQVFCIPSLIIILYTWHSRLKEHGQGFFWSVSGILFSLPWILGLMDGSISTNYIADFLYAVIGLVGLWWIRWWMIRPEY